MARAASSAATSIWSCWAAWPRWPAGSRSMCSSSRLRLGLVCVAIVACAAPAGCGRKSNVVPVSGKVTVNGQPLANVAVNFGPLTGGLDGAYASYGKTDADGRFTLKLVDNGQPG